MVAVVELYNNIVYNANFKADFGFGCMIRGPDILLDTGAKGDILLQNMSRAGIDPASVRSVVLSHDHWDHCGGLPGLLYENPGINVYILRAFSKETVDTIRAHGGVPVFVEGWRELAPGIYSTGPVKNSVIEHSIAIRTPEGFFVISGCAHPHISSLIRAVFPHGKVRGAIGGFHSISDQDIESLSDLDYLSPSHCTERMEEIRVQNPGTFVQGGVGKVHRFE
ncbi:MAG: MBL fold metallo-hydrolase [Methanomicrobiaceae archaeon]|nr:MBL fold metallo-hydrolase [Methanomicrobiaceae archaeon]